MSDPTRGDTQPSQAVRAALDGAEAAFADGRSDDALRQLLLALRYTHTAHPLVQDDALWKRGLAVFRRLTAEVASSELEALLRESEARYADPDWLFEVGYQLIELGLPGVAATALARAHRLLPNHAGVLLELSAALELGGRNDLALHHLDQAADVRAKNWMATYLYAFNALMVGDLERARQQSPRLGEARSDGERFMAAFMEQALRRADALASITALDASDLRGWHLVLNGGLLLHESPFGRDAGMNGRYAFLQDHPALCLEGIRRVEAVLEHLDRMPPQVLALADRGSAILATAASRALALPLREYPEAGTTDPGLIVAYDLGNATGETLSALQRHHPGQVLWSHACDWLGEQPVAADLVTFLYQVNTPFWEGGLRVDPDTRKVERAGARDDAIELLADEILAAPLEDDALSDIEAVRAIADAALAFSSADGAGPFSPGGRRPRQRIGGPVGSNRFL